MATVRPARVLRRHEWLDADGVVAFEHYKKDDGSWSYRHPSGRTCEEHPDAKPKRGWCYRKPEVAKWLLWNFAGILNALTEGVGSDIGWFAGEKDADAASAAGLHDVCTTVHQGEAADVYPEQAEHFRDFEGSISIYCDDDPTGWANGIARVEALRAVGARKGGIRLFLPAEGSNDVYDALNDADSRARGFREVSATELRGMVRAAERAKRKRSEGSGSGLGASEEKLQAFEEALSAGGFRHGTGQDWQCPSPGHKDEHPSFGVKIGENGGLVLNCQKCMPKGPGSETEKEEWIADILDTLDLPEDILAPPKRKRGGKQGGREKDTVSDRIRALALELYTFGMNDEGKPFAYRNDGHVTFFFDKGNGALAHDLSWEYSARYDKVPGSSGMADAIANLTGLAQRKEPQEIALRVAAIGDDVGKRIVVDMGDVAERVVTISPEGWEVSAHSPVLFRRTKATLAYPEPICGGGGIEAFAELLNVSPRDFDLIVSWMLSTFIPDIQHPALMLNGEHGTGKSDATRMITMLCDPNVAPLRGRPKDERDWSVAAAASWVISLENLSRIEEWLSDDLCMAITGVGDVERQYHTNDDIRIRKIRRVIIANGIDPGGVRGDLADRMFAIRLRRIKQRLSESALEAKFEELRPVLFGAMLDLLVEVRRKQLSGASWVETNERMYDFAQFCRAVDLVRGSETFERFCELRTEGVAEVTDDDPLTTIVRDYLVGHKRELIGTPSEIYLALRNSLEDASVVGWPKTPRGLSQAITRLTPGWRDMGILVGRKKSMSTRTLFLKLEDTTESSQG